MKSIISTGHVCLCTLLIFIINTHAQETEKINLSAGLGFTEAINLGVRFQMEQSQLGLYIGALPGSEGSVFSAGGDYYYHFGGSSDFSARKPWYVKAGLSYLHDKDEFNDNKYILLMPRAGRDLNLSSRIGIAVDLGIGVPLHRDEIELEYDWISDFFFGSDGRLPDVFPSFGINFFYRL